MEGDSLSDGSGCVTSAPKNITGVAMILFRLQDKYLRLCLQLVPRTFRTHKESLGKLLVAKATFVPPSLAFIFRQTLEKV